MAAEQTERQERDEQDRSRKLSQERRSPPLDIPGYSARQFIGSGAYGEVWVAIDKNTGRRVAIKFYAHRGGLDGSLLSREVEKLVFLSADRYVVQLLEVGWDAEPPYYVMEYIENGSLEDYLREQPSLTVSESVEVFREVATGLLHAHGKGVLHCDLKPANVLLDQDNKPRLADFGQSRLSHEQTPALGTLFFMAPEQADLQAVPDARWDVYALGALLYCMLTGEAPYRSDDAISEIESAVELDARLAKYRTHLQSHPPPTTHRSVKGIDRPLVETIDRCLAIDPDDRFANVQSVLDALEARDASRERRPLLILGLLGPMIFLMVTIFFAWWGYLQAVGDSERLLLVRGQESNGFAADFVSEAVARRIEGYFRAVEAVARDPAFQAMLTDMRNNDACAELLEQLRDQRADGASVNQWRAELAALAGRQALQRKMTDLLAARSREDIASWFVTDEFGFHLAAAFDTPTETSSVGRDFSFRTYFHGGPTDHRPDDGGHVEQTHMSAVFRSEVTKAPKVAISTPIEIDGLFLGVVALTVELGRWDKLLSSEKSERQFSVLVDGREGPGKGVILQHPLFRRTGYLGQFQTSTDYRVPLERWNENRLYVDPLGRHPQGNAFSRKWIAAKRAVRLDPTERGARMETETGLIVIVQENYDVAATPIHNLGDLLLFRGAVALAVVVLVIFVLWYFVSRALNERGGSIYRNGNGRKRLTTIHSMDTVELPHQLQR